MEKMMEMVEMWVKSQKEFAANVVKAQKDGAAYWADAAAKAQESFKGFGFPQEGPTSEARTFCDSLMKAAASSAKAIAEDAGKMQEAWKDAFEKQVDLAGGIAKQFAGMFQPAAAQK